MLGSEWAQKINRRSESNGKGVRTGTGFPSMESSKSTISAFSDV